MIQPQRRRTGNSPSTPEKNRNTPISEKARKATRGSSGEQRKHDSIQESMEIDKRQDQDRPPRGKNRGFPDRQIYQSGNFRRFEPSAGGKMQRDNRQFQYRRQDEDDGQKHRRDNVEPWRSSNRRNDHHKRNPSNRQGDQSHYGRYHNRRHHEFPSGAPNGRGCEPFDDLSDLHVAAFSEVSTLPHEATGDGFFDEDRMRQSSRPPTFENVESQESVGMVASSCFTTERGSFEEGTCQVEKFVSQPYATATNLGSLTGVECFIDSSEPHFFYAQPSASVDFETMSRSGSDDCGQEKWNFMAVKDACSSYASLETMPSLKRNSVECCKVMGNILEEKLVQDSDCGSQVCNYPLATAPQIYPFQTCTPQGNAYQAYTAELWLGLIRCADGLQSAMQLCLQQSIDQSANQEFIKVAANCLEYQWRDLMESAELFLVHGGLDDTGCAMAKFRDVECWLNGILGFSECRTPIALRIAMTCVPEHVLIEAVRRTRFLSEADYE